MAMAGLSLADRGGAGRPGTTEKRVIKASGIHYSDGNDGSSHSAFHRAHVIVGNAEADPALALLLDAEWLHPLPPTGSGKPGRPPSPRFAVNPAALAP